MVRIRFLHNGLFKMQKTVGSRWKACGKNPSSTAKGAYPIASLTWIIAYEKGNVRKTKAIKQAINTLLSDEYQDKAASLGFIPLKGDILLKSRAAVEKIGS